MIDPSQLAKIYDAYYYAHGCGSPCDRGAQWLGFFDQIAEQITARINPQTVLDAGCGWGLLVEALRKRGVRAYGIDISEYAIRNVHASVQSYCGVGNIAEGVLPAAGLGQDQVEHYDLIVCIEVLEHIPFQDTERVIRNFCQHSRDILFSSTPFDYKEVTHFNVQPPEHWAESFARQQFFRDVDFDAAFITPWAVRYRYREENLARLVREYERRFFQLWKENIDLRNLTVEMRQELANSHQIKQDSALSLPDLEKTADINSRPPKEQLSWVHKLRQKLRRL